LKIAVECNWFDDVERLVVDTERREVGPIVQAAPPSFIASSAKFFQGPSNRRVRIDSK
jgi:hypothetical protein